eukprot:7749693-Pyramimonas_sp.AAC.1
MVVPVPRQRPRAPGIASAAISAQVCRLYRCRRGWSHGFCDCASRFPRLGGHRGAPGGVDVGARAPDADSALGA